MPGGVDGKDDMNRIGHDQRAILVNGKRELLFSGAIHYPRSTPGMWPELMKRSVDAGLNTVETYVFWNLHERRRGIYDFSDRLDLLRFCARAQEHKLHVILRMGPYICAETNYGGFPAWLRALPGMRMRTNNEPFKREVENWMRILCEYLRPMFPSAGGPVILAQIENEYGNLRGRYGEDGRQYLRWCAELARALNVGVPWVMCAGSAPGTLETMNSLFAHEMLDKHFLEHPDQPPIWTENWLAWYDTWGYPHHRRSPENAAYGVARFFAAGGAGVNYYMWHGGTNFGRETHFLQTTSYAYDAPLDEFGLPTTKLRHLRHLHRLLARYADLLLDGDRAKPQRLGDKQAAFVYRARGRSLSFLYNDDTEPAKVTFKGKIYRLKPRSVQIGVGGRIVMDTAVVARSSTIKRAMHPLSGALAPFAWQAEPLAEMRSASESGACIAARPIEQLRLTEDATDYCWYSSSLTTHAREAGTGILALRGVGDIVYLYVDGALRGSTALPLKEDRGATSGSGFAQSFKLNLSQGEHTLSILCCAMGLIKGDWQIGWRNMVGERKGLWGSVSWNGRRIGGAWTMRPGLVGEKEGWWRNSGNLVKWRKSRSAVGKPLQWWRTTFLRPKGAAPLALDLNGMNKGMAWLDGRCIGRYWLIESKKEPSGNVILSVGMGQSTQRYYHVPREWVADENALVLFEEAGGDPRKVQLCEWR